jgi:hypothetical protein
MRILQSLVVAVTLGMVAAGCEDNTAPAVAGFGPPTNVLAQSVNATSVGLSWGPPAGVVDTLVAAYIISYGDVRDSIPGSPRMYTAANLLQGIASFTLQAVSMDRQYSNTTGKSWAPAARYDSVFSLYEYDVSQLLRNSALNIGTRTEAPSAVPVALAAQLPFDAYVVGQGGQQLSLKGGQMFNTAYDPFLFADRADVAPSLDYYIDQFPTTYTRSEVVLRDNSIYYARGTGAPGETHYVRIHVRFGPGTYPNRTVIISLSVQKVPSLQFASSGGGELGSTPVSPLTPGRS